MSTPSAKNWTEAIVPSLSLAFAVTCVGLPAFTVAPAAGPVIATKGGAEIVMTLGLDAVTLFLSS